MICPSFPQFQTRKRRSIYGISNKSSLTFRKGNWLAKCLRRPTAAVPDKSGFRGGDIGDHIDYVRGVQGSKGSYRLWERAALLPPKGKSPEISQAKEP